MAAWDKVNKMFVNPDTGEDFFADIPDGDAEEALNLAGSKLETALNLAAEATSICMDTTYGVTDATGDTCTWYTSYPEHCGVFDTETFIASSMCCGCGGGEM